MGIFYRFRKVTPYGFIRGEVVERTVLGVLSESCSFSGVLFLQRRAAVISATRETPCEFDVLHPFL